MHVYHRDYKYFLDTELYVDMLLNDDTRTIYEAHKGLDRDTVLGVCSRRWANWNELVPVLRNNDIQ